MKKRGLSNAEFTRESDIFKRACKLGKVEPTVRQASKFRNDKGTAWKFKKEAAKEQRDAPYLEVLREEKCTE